MILLHFELITCRFGYGSDRKPRFPWFLDFWVPCEPFVDLNAPNYLKQAKKIQLMFKTRFWKFGVCKLENLKIWEIVTSLKLVFWNLVFLSFEIVDSRILKIWNFETLKLWNDGTKKRRDKETLNLLNTWHLE